MLLVNLLNFLQLSHLSCSFQIAFDWSVANILITKVHKSKESKIKDNTCVIRKYSWKSDLQDRGLSWVALEEYGKLHLPVMTAPQINFSHSV